MFKKIAILCVCLLGATACSMETDGEEGLESLTENVWTTWNPHSQAGNTVGMAIAQKTGSAYQWLTGGTVCRGTAADPCGGTSYAYSAPNNCYTCISGVGIAKNTNHVYAWYSDGTVSQGSSDNLTAHNGKLAFTRPAKPSGGTFSMSQLIEVDNSDNGDWYYYWLDGSIVYRTTGASNNGSSSSTAQQVTVTSPSSIVGIAFGTGSPASVITFFSNGNRNISTSSLNLVQQ
jgi:hypothetical protein